MSEPIDFLKRKAERDAGPTWSGAAKCISCKHEWDQPDTSLNDEWIDCPKCGLTHGHAYKTFGAMQGESFYRCNCGCEAFTLIIRNDFHKVKCCALTVMHSMKFASMLKPCLSLFVTSHLKPLRLGRLAGPNSAV